MAERLAEALTPELELSGRLLGIRASIGLVMAEPGARGDELLRNADIAMYRAKSHAKGGIRVFEAELHQMAIDIVKIDKSFVDTVHTSPEQAKLVAGSCSSARACAWRSWPRASRRPRRPTGALDALTPGPGLPVQPAGQP